MCVCNYKHSVILQSLRWLGGPQPETGTTELIKGPAQAIFSHFIWKSPQWNLLSLFVYLFPFHCITDLLLLLTSKSFVTTVKLMRRKTKARIFAPHIFNVDDSPKNAWNTIRNCFRESHYFSSSEVSWMYVMICLFVCWFHLLVSKIKQKLSGT